MGVGLVPSDDSVSAAQWARIRATVAEALRAEPWAADTFTYDELADPQTPDRPYLEAYRRSFHPQRTADVQIRFREHYLFQSGRVATNHGSPYEYDTRVPLIFFGFGVEPGRHDLPVRSVDIAPTLARFLQIETPADLDGRWR